MMNRSKSASLAALWLIAIVMAMVGVSCTSMSTNTSNANGGSPTPDPCATITDKEIMDNIYADLAKDSGLRTQLKSIDVVVKARTVSLWGWVLTDAQRTQVIDIASRSKCVTPPVTADNFYVEGSIGSSNPVRPGPGGGCVLNYMRCGDICVPVGTGCGLEKTLVCGETAASPTNSNSAGNMNTKTVTNANTNSNMGYSNSNTKKP